MQKKNVTQQVPEELGATGGSVPKPMHASGATGLGKSLMTVVFLVLKVQ